MTPVIAGDWYLRTEPKIYLASLNRYLSPCIQAGEAFVEETTLHSDSHTRWNFIVVTLDAALFAAAWAVMDPTAVLPVFLGTMTKSPLIIGFMGAIQRAGWILPQLAVASWLSHRERKLPFLMITGWLSRMPILVMAYIVYRCAGQHQQIALCSVIIGFAVFYLLDGSTGVPWHDIIGKSIPANIRGRFFGVMQFIGAALAIGSGEIVRRVLSSKTLGYPNNYALLLLITFILFAFSGIFLILMREPLRPVAAEAEGLGQLLKRIPKVLRERRIYRRMIVTQVLAYSGALASPFYSWYARDKLGAPAEMGGIYVWALTLGTLVGSIVWAYMSDRHGASRVVRATCIFVVLTPLSAIAVRLSGLQGAVGYYTFATVFFLSGIAIGGVFLGFINYLLEIVGHEERAAFIAMTTTLTAPVILMPIIGGQLLNVVPYEAVFALAALGGAAAWIRSRKMIEPRAVAS
jgi:hypothetical protein